MISYKFQKYKKYAENKKIVLKLDKNKITVNNKLKDTWCKLPYPGHPNGCPNYRKKRDCPPNTPFIFDILEEPFWLVGIRFDIKNKGKPIENYSSFSEENCCCFPPGQNENIFRQEIQKTLGKESDIQILYKPEAYGVDVFKTCKDNDLDLEFFPPKKYLWKIVVAGKKKQTL